MTLVTDQIAGVHFLDRPGRREAAGEKHLFIFGSHIHNPYTLNDVSAYTDVRATDVPTRAEVITKKIRSATAFREVFRPESYFSVRQSVRQNLIYSSYGTRGREYKETPKFDRSKRQRSKDYEPQKRVTPVLEKPVPCFKILSKGQCRASFERIMTDQLIWPVMRLRCSIGVRRKFFAVELIRSKAISTASSPWDAL